MDNLTGFNCMSSIWKKGVPHVTRIVKEGVFCYEVDDGLQLSYTVTTYQF